MDGDQLKFELKLKINGLPKTLNQLNSLRHWALRHAHTKQWKQLVWQAILQNQACGRPPNSYATHPLLPKAHLKLIRCSSSQPDFDNLCGSFKCVIDGLKAAKIILDDKPEVIGQPIYEWRKAPRLEGHILIEVFGISE